MRFSRIFKDKKAKNQYEIRNLIQGVFNDGETLTSEEIGERLKGAGYEVDNMNSFRMYLAYHMSGYLKRIRLRNDHVAWALPS